MKHTKKSVSQFDRTKGRARKKRKEEMTCEYFAFARKYKEFRKLRTTNDLALAKSCNAGMEVAKLLLGKKQNRKRN
jgi:hypothetical protein